MIGVAPKPNQDSPLFGIGLMLLAYACFSCIDTSSKTLALAGLPALQLAFMRYFGHFLISLFMIARGGTSLARFGSQQPLLVFGRAVLLVASTVLNFTALRYLPLTVTSTLQFSAPIMICALSWPLLGERVGVVRWSAILVGFFGILLVIRPFEESFHWAMVLSLGTAGCFAIYSLLTRKLAGTVAADTMQLYSGLTGTIALLPFAFLEWQTPASGFHWLLLLAMGFFGWLGHQVLTNAHGFAPASTLTPFGYSFILYMTVWSYVVFNELPDQWTIVGAAIIVAAGLAIWLREKRLSRSDRKTAILETDS